jgi:hypothetical protein
MRTVTGTPVLRDNNAVYLRFEEIYQFRFQGLSVRYQHAAACFMLLRLTLTLKIEASFLRNVS